MSKASARTATSLPMRPSPIKPSVLPRNSVCPALDFSQRPSCMALSSRGTCRARASISANVCSATLTELPPGVLITRMPRFVASSRSMLSTPTPARPTTRSFGAFASSSAVTFVALRTMSASAPGNSAPSVSFVVSTTFHPRCSFSSCTPRSLILSATITFMRVSSLQGGFIAKRQEIYVSGPASALSNARCGRAGPVLTNSAPRAAGLADFAAKVGGKHFNGAAHFVKPRTHACADTIRKSIFANGDALAPRSLQRLRGAFRFIEIICREDGHAAFVVTPVEHQADDIEHPRGGLAGAEVVEHEDFRRSNRIENAHLRGFARRIVAGLNFLEQFAIVAEETVMTAPNQLLERSNGEMSLADAGRTHQQQPFFRGAGIIAHESLRQHFRVLK